MEGINNNVNNESVNPVIENNSISPVEPTPKQNNTFKILFFITLVTLIGVVIASFLLKNQKQTINEEQVNTSTSNIDIETKEETDDTLKPSQTKEEISDPKQILKELQKNLNTNSSLEDSKIGYPSCDIKIDDKERVPLVGQQFFICGKNYKTIDSNCSAWGNFNNISEITKESLQPLKLLADDFFISNNFKKDVINSLIVDSGTTEYVGYTKGDLRCYLGLVYTPHNNLYFTLDNHIAFFFCGTIDQNNLNLKKDLYSTINSTNSTDVFFEINTVVDNYARGGKGTYSSGACAFNSWFAVKLNEKWELVWDSDEGYKKNQNWIPCNIVDKYNIPKEITSSCYDTTKSEMKTM